MIDIGGPSMLRGAAKNFAHCIPSAAPISTLRPRRAPARGEVSLADAARPRGRAFAHDRRVRRGDRDVVRGARDVPGRLSSIAFEKAPDLSYGENPHQRGAYYAERGARAHLLSRVEQLHGKALSFNNLNDLSAALSSRGSSSCPRA